jgi:trehalose 6-phosphate phosphatase
MSDRLTALEALAAERAAAGLILDFDGVLSPIVQDPATSELPAQAGESLARLVSSLGLVAIISGRPVDFLASQVRIPGIRLLGSYGMEQIQADGSRRVDERAQEWVGKIPAAGQTLRAALTGLAGITVEQKSVSVAVHWRRAPDHDVAAEAVRRVVGEVATATGLRIEPGKLVEELRPPIAVDKGSAVTALLAGQSLKAVAYAGDDVGDLPALTAVRAAGGYALVVDHGSETDPRLRELADQTFPGTDAFAAWLAELAAAAGA